MKTFTLFLASAFFMTSSMHGMELNEDMQALLNAEKEYARKTEQRWQELQSRPDRLRNIHLMVCCCLPCFATYYFIEERCCPPGRENQTHNPA